MTIDTTISVNTAINDDNTCEFRGIIPGFICGFCAEIVNIDGSVNYSPVIYTNDYFSIEYDYDTREYNDFGVALADTLYSASKRVTGRIIFQGYYTIVFDHDDWENYGYSTASNEAMLTEEYRKYPDYIKPLTYNPFVGLVL